MKKLILLTISMVFLSGANQPDEDVWYMSLGYTGKCVASINEYKDYRPEVLINRYGCNVTGTDHGLLSVECNGGELDGQSYAFTKSMPLCELVAKAIKDSE